MKEDLNPELYKFLIWKLSLDSLRNSAAKLSFYPWLVSRKSCCCSNKAWPSRVYFNRPDALKKSMRFAASTTAPLLVAISSNGSMLHVRYATAGNDSPFSDDDDIVEQDDCVAYQLGSEYSVKDQFHGGLKTNQACFSEKESPFLKDIKQSPTFTALVIDHCNLDMHDMYSLLMLLLLPPLLTILIKKLFTTTHPKGLKTNPRLPNSFPIIGSFFTIQAHLLKDRLTWITAQLRASPTSTVVVLKPLFGGEHIITANPSNVEHILKTKFAVYEKGSFFTTILRDLLGHGIFNVDGEEWKLQRHVASHEFSTNSLRKFVEQVVDTELDSRLLPILARAADKGTVCDLQDLLQRFAFDNICKIAFGYDSALLLPSLPDLPFADAFETAVAISSKRFRVPVSMIWRIKRFLNVGSERQLRKAVYVVRDFAANIVKQKTQQVPSSESELNLDLLSRFIKSGSSDEQFLTDIVISFILAGRDTTSAALTWFFWLLAKNPAVESEIVKEIRQSDANAKGSAYDYTKELVYTHAALHESMRLYPPVAVDTKQVSADGEDDVWPDGSVVKRGSTVAYHVYAMGRMERIWGEDWPEFRPERWLEGEGRSGKKVFVSKNPYSYPVFQAGPRVCLGKEMALLQMKRVVAGVLRRFRVVPTAAEGVEPVLQPYLTGRMEGGLAVRFESRRV